MAVWSTFMRAAGQQLQKTRLLAPLAQPKNAIVKQIQVRDMSGHMEIQATRWQWHRTKDLCHFYFLVAAIPLGAITLLANMFVGPATLTEIPEGYEPKHWEYYKSPITRFFARYVFNTPQKDYEKNLHAVYEEGELVKIRQLEDKIWKLQAERQDYRYNHFLPVSMFGAREVRELIKRDNDSMM